MAKWPQQIEMVGLGPSQFDSHRLSELVDIGPKRGSGVLLFVKLDLGTTNLTKARSNWDLSDANIDQFADAMAVASAPFRPHDGTPRPIYFLNR